jgi:hypothetical protein
VKENLAFIRDHAEHPVNFCRAEPYHGTPLHLELSREQDLGGSYLGWNYRIEDDRAELLFRICSAAFRERNFAPRGVANRYMGLGYAGNVLRRFYPGERAEALREKARLLTRAISLDSARFLEQAIALAETAAPSDHDRIERETARLALDVAAADAGWHEELDDLYDAMNAEAAAPRERERFLPTQKLMKLVREATFSATLAAAATVTLDGCGGMVVDPVPVDAGMDSMVVDPPPPDAGRDEGVATDTPDSGFVVDPVPDDAPIDAPDDTGFVVDPPPPDAGMAAADRPADREAEDDRAYAEGGALKRRLRLVDQWRDSAPVRSVRTGDLALAAPPSPRLVGRREDGVIVVRIEDVPGTYGTRWEAEGVVDGDGPEITWRPASDRSHVRVAVRSRHGVAVVSLRASDV